MIKGPILQDDIIILNGYACDKRASKYIKLKLTNNRQLHYTSAGEFNTLFSAIG